MQLGAVSLKAKLAPSVADCPSSNSGLAGLGPLTASHGRAKGRGVLRLPCVECADALFAASCERRTHSFLLQEEKWRALAFYVGFKSAAFNLFELFSAALTLKFTLLELEPDL